MGTFSGVGGRIVFPAPSGGVIVGRMYLIGVFALLALATAPEGQDTVFALGGVRNLPKAASVEFGPGELVYYDSAAHNVNTTGAGRFPIGATTGVVAADDEFVQVRLFNQATAVMQ